MLKGVSDSSVGKGCRCVRLTILPPQPPGNIQACTEGKNEKKNPFGL